MRIRLSRTISTAKEMPSVIDTERFAKSIPVQQALLVDRECGTNAKIGAHGARATPVPIPNTAVKPRSGYNTWGSPLGR